MAKKGRRAPSEGKEAAAEKGATKLRMDQPFDHWLHKQLHEMYDAIAKEPLPDDLMRLIDQDASSSSGPGAAKPPLDSDGRKKP